MYFSFFSVFTVLLTVFLIQRVNEVQAIQKDFFLKSRSFAFYIVYHRLRQICTEWNEQESKVLSMMPFRTYTAFERLHANFLPTPNVQLLQAIKNLGIDTYILEHKQDDTNLVNMIEFCDSMMASLNEQDNGASFAADIHIERPFQVLSISDGMTELIITERAYTAKLWSLNQHFSSLMTLHVELEATLYPRVHELRSLMDFHLEQSIYLEEKLADHLNTFIQQIIANPVLHYYTKFIASRLDVLLSSSDGPEALYFASPFLNENVADLTISPMQRICKYPLLLRAIYRDEKESDMIHGLQRMINIINDYRAVADVHSAVSDWKNIEPLSLGSILLRTAARICIFPDPQNVEKCKWQHRILHVHDMAMIFFKKKDEYRVPSFTLPATSMSSEHSIKTITQMPMIAYATYKIIGQLTFSSIMRIKHDRVRHCIIIIWNGQPGTVFIQLQEMEAMARLFDLIQSRLPSKIPRDTF